MNQPPVRTMEEPPRMHAETREIEVPKPGTIRVFGLHLGHIFQPFIAKVVSAELDNATNRVLVHYTAASRWEKLVFTVLHDKRGSIVRALKGIAKGRLRVESRTEWGYGVERQGDFIVLMFRKTEFVYNLQKQDDAT